MVYQLDIDVRVLDVPTVVVKIKKEDGWEYVITATDDGSVADLRRVIPVLGSALQAARFNLAKVNKPRETDQWQLDHTSGTSQCTLEVKDIGVLMTFQGRPGFVFPS